MDSMNKRRVSHSETRKEAHLRLLQELEQLPPIESCCDVCHCDCYSSHRSSEVSPDKSIYNFEPELAPERCSIPTANCCQTKPKHDKKPKRAVAKSKKRSSICAGDSSKSPPKCSKSSLGHCGNAKAKGKPKPRSKSACSQRSSNNNHSRPTSPLAQLSTRNLRDCQVLQDLLLHLDANPRLEVNTRRQGHRPEEMPSQHKWSSMGNLPQPQELDEQSAGPLKLCASMANLCLKSDVRQAYQRVPAHDKKILNRMACKRTEKIMAKENAWLARKYWENERYERELLKCEQMEEYKMAVRDKQFQDYLVTKARLNELAERDLAELQRLRHTVKAKDARAQKRLRAIRVERDLQLCQRRCDELRKAEAVNMQQGEHELEESMRRTDTCNRLSERLHRANLMRAAMLDAYLKRLRNDNYIEQLMHEEKWREAQEFELAKREQLQEHISRKRTRAQRFVETRQRRNADITKTAKISANLRQLVRNSVTPESLMGGGSAAWGGGNAGGSTLSLGRLLMERSLPKLNLP